VSHELNIPRFLNIPTPSGGVPVEQHVYRGVTIRAGQLDTGESFIAVDLPAGKQLVFPMDHSNADVIARGLVAPHVASPNGNNNGGGRHRLE
jgi:hypothetical protein